MRGGARVPGQLLAGAAGALAGRLERCGVVEQLAQRGGQGLDVVGRHDAPGAVAANRLGEAADVVDDRWHARAERLQERAGLIELGAVGEDGDLIDDVETRRREYGSADREDAEEAFGDYQLALEALKDRLTEIRDTYAATLADSEEYERAFERAAVRRWPDIEAV